MKLRKLFYIVTIINIMFQIVYMTFGRHTEIELGVFNYIFYIFRPEYFIVSGIFSFIVNGMVVILNIKSLLTFIIKSKRDFNFHDLIIFILNVEYMMFHFKILMLQ